jgi:hypothetical protein
MRGWGSGLVRCARARRRASGRLPCGDRAASGTTSTGNQPPLPDFEPGGEGGRGCLRSTVRAPDRAARVGRARPTGVRYTYLILGQRSRSTWMQCRTVCSTAGTLRSSAKVTSRRFAYHQDRVWVTFTHFSELKSGPRRPASQHRHLIARASRCRCCGRRRSGEAVAPDPLFRPGSRGAGEDGADDEVRVGGV